MEGIKQQLTQLMDEELECVTALHKVLMTEQDAVKRKQIEEMNATLTDKVALLERLQILDEQRKGILSTAGYDNTKEGFLKLLAQLQDPGLEEFWQNLHQQLVSCREQHQINSRLLDIGMRQVRRLLGAMLGDQSETAVTSVYDRQGTATQSLTTHTYVKA